MSHTTKSYNFTNYFTEILISFIFSYCWKENKVPLNCTKYYNVILNEYINYRDTWLFIFRFHCFGKRRLKW